MTHTRGIAACAAILLLTVTAVSGQDAKQMAITFDDLPFGYNRNLPIEQQRESVARVLATLRAHRVTAAMFVVGSGLTERNRDFVDAVAAAGHTIGNHSFSHRDLGTMPVEDYAIDIQKGGDAILNALYLDELLQRLRDSGWSFIPFEEALTDPAYALKYDHAGVRGAGHLDAIKPSR